VPTSYTIVPPRSLEGVKLNLVIITECLDPVHDINNVVLLIDELKSQIYPVINDFIEQALIVLTDCLSLYGNDATNFAVVELEVLERKLGDQETKSSFDDLLWDQLFAVAQDIRYLYRMKELEDGSKATERLMDAVPVTGLILARICSLENELRTVLELWEDKLQDTQEVKEGEVESGGSKKAVEQDEGKRTSVYTGFKKALLNGSGDVLKMLQQGGQFNRHRKRGWSKPTLVRVSDTMDRIICTVSGTSTIKREVVVSSITRIVAGKNSDFWFYAFDKCSFYFTVSEGESLNLEAKSKLERDKWVAAFRWLLGCLYPSFRTSD